MREPGPLIVVDARANPDEADTIAARDALAAGCDGMTGLGLGWAMPDAYAPDGLWLHVYATTRPSGLSAAIEALGSP